MKASLVTSKEEKKCTVGVGGPLAVLNVGGITGDQMWAHELCDES